MTRNRIFLALLVVQMVTLGAFAQSEPVVSATEFGRASGGSIDAITKGTNKFSGSLSLTHSSGSLRGQGYEGTLSGELLEDRLWFFAAAAVLPQVHFSTPQLAGLEAKATAQPVDWTTVAASFTQLGQPVFSTTSTFDGSLPTSFLSLRATSLLSERTMLNVSFTRSGGTQNAFPAAPFGAQ